MLNVHAPTDIYAPIGPYALAVEATSVRRLLFISGTMGLAPHGALAGDFEAQAHRVWSNIDATLTAAGMGRGNLVKLAIWFADASNWRRGAEIRQQYLGDHKVAMSLPELLMVPRDAATCQDRQVRLRSFGVAWLRSTALLWQP